MSREAERGAAPEKGLRLDGAEQMVVTSVAILGNKSNMGNDASSSGKSDAEKNKAGYAETSAISLS